MKSEVRHNQPATSSEETDFDGDRRDTIKAIGDGAIAPGTSGSGSGAAVSAAAAPRGETASAKGPYNFLFILTDQERYFRPGELPRDYALPAHERLANKGIVFENHQINSAVCTSSRSVLYTGRHIQQTKMFDNTNFP